MSTPNSTSELTVALDAGGADAGPGEVLRGALHAVAADPGLRILWYGPAGAVDVDAVPAAVTIADAPLSIAKDSDPAAAVRRHPEASVVQAVKAVADGAADALVSGGSTGAVLAAALFRIKRARGVHRPALAVMVPVPEHPFLLLDAGANVDVRAEHLVQFAHMGSAYMSVVAGLKRPRIGLLSVGEEAGKGRAEVVAAGAALAGDEAVIGNVEGFAVGTGVADVIVTDGWTGNVLLKTMEGTSHALLGAIRSAATSSPRAKLGGVLLRPALGGLKGAIDPEAAGGAVLLGLRRLVVVPHGSFSARGIAAAINVAARGAREDLVGRTQSALEAAGALRAKPSAASPNVTGRES